MKKISFTTTINASPEKVWEVLWSERYYREWTSAFTPGAYAESDWKEGSTIRFLSPQGEGMRSLITKKVPNKHMAFRHLGPIAGGKDVEPDEESREWIGATEDYLLEAADEGTVLKVEVDVTDKHESYFQETFPRALKRIKDLSEQGS
jgi:uncharacterized protein YndB with AHSA1/START domain